MQNFNFLRSKETEEIPGYQSVAVCSVYRLKKTVKKCLNILLSKNNHKPREHSQFYIQKGVLSTSLCRCSDQFSRQVILWKFSVFVIVTGF